MYLWFVETLRQYPEIAIFLSLGIGYWTGAFKYKGFGLGAVTATLLASIAIGQFGVVVSPNVKSIFFLLFLFAVGYGVGPQFVRGIAKDGLPQALFSVVVCLFCLAAPVVATKLVGYDLGTALGLYAGSQTISASMGLGTDAINRLGLAPEAAKALLDAMPVAYAVTYIFGTVGTAIVLAMLGPWMLRIDLAKECKRYELEMGGVSGSTVGQSAWQSVALRAYKVQEGSLVAGKSAQEAEALVPNARIFVERIRRNGVILDAAADTVLAVGDIVAVAASRETLLEILGHTGNEVEDIELLSIQAEGVDLYITNKEVNGQTLSELGKLPQTRGVFLRKIVRGATATQIPVLASTKLYQGDVITVVGRVQDTNALAKLIGFIDRPTEVTDVATVGFAIAVGALIGALTYKLGNIPLTLSTAGGALIAGIVFGWFRSTHPTFGRIPPAALWFMNSVGLNVFIAVIGLTAGPNFISGLKTLGLSLFMWGIVATTVPLVLSMLVARFVFKFDPAILFGCVAGARTSTAALGMLCDNGKSQVPGLGYTVTYAVGNTLLTIWGMVMVLVLT
ncbi:aspartate-alanine antiporter [Undibacterium sp.]|uniref:aspartate-alanine antiporter n=1 Tax=Undibacterium sp. TaxID=1914977 RepID=UPI0025F5E60A|nr:aspartate-alanine antiporter [Undibacterium sp.]